jgi:DNA polymerase elongation subunit (family B)
MMIIDYTSDDPYEPPIIYERTRGADGVLKERYITHEDSDFVYPFCWLRQNAPTWVLNRLRNFHARILTDEIGTGLDGGKLWKVEVNHPNTLWEIKDAVGKWTHEADLNYLDQILLTNYPEGIPEFHPRKWYYDLEWQTTGDGAITVMAVADSDAEHPVVFSWSEESIRLSITKTEWIDRYGGYELRTYRNEDKMLAGFLDYLKERDPDMLIAHAGAWADLPKLHDRMGVLKHDMSPLGIFLPPKKNNEGYKVTGQPIKGRLVFDSAARWEEGSGFEGVWQKSGRGKAQQRKLNWFATELGLGHKLTDDIEGMTVHNGWSDYYDDFVDYCLVDTTLLRDIDEKLHCTDFHFALQQVAGVQFGSTHNVSRYFRGLIGRKTNLKAPTSFIEERPDLQAAWVMPPVAGRHQNVALVDFASLYPNIILSANLCWTTMCDHAGPNILTLDIPAKIDDDGNYIPGTGGVFHWRQDREGLLPKVVKDMLALRKHYKNLMKTSTDPDEKLGYNMLQMAVKVAVNAIYGMVGSRKVRGQWSSYEIAQSITYLGRESISMLVKKSEEMGYRGLAGHTDSCYIQVPFEEAEVIAQRLTDIAQNEMGLKYLDVELEAFFPYWFTANVKNRNFGIKSWPPEDAGDMKVTGFSIKASNAPPLTKEILGKVFKMISSGDDEDTIHHAVRPQVKSVYEGSITPTEASSYGSISKNLNEYDKVVPNPAKAARYSNEYLGTSYGKNDSVRWIFVDDVPEGQPYCNVVGFEDERQLSEYSIDWTTIVNKWIHSKLKSVYETLDWDLERLTARRVPRKLW